MCALGSWLAGLAAIGWSVRFITPDLLASGLICLATSQMVQARQGADWFSAAFSGLLWGLAYLTKPIALPLALAVGLGFLLIKNHSTAYDLRQRIKTFFLTLSVLALVALAVVLSVCSTVDAFVALAFARTFTTGSLLAFLAFGPMVDIKNTLMFLTVFRRRTVVYLVLLPLLMIVLACVFINFNLSW